MKKVYLLGELGKKFGRKFELNVQTPADVIRALRANFPEFERHMVESDRRNVGYRVIVGKESISETQLHDPTGKQSIKIVPVLMGAGGGGGFFNIVLGSVLIVAGVVGNVFFPGNPISPYLINAGVAMAIGGVVQLLTPVPKMGPMGEENQLDRKKSYVFNGPINTTAQGYPVPVGYGKMIVGSSVISAGIAAEELPV